MRVLAHINRVIVYDAPSGYDEEKKSFYFPQVETNASHKDEKGKSQSTMDQV